MKWKNVLVLRLSSVFKVNNANDCPTFVVVSLHSFILFWSTHLTPSFHIYNLQKEMSWKVSIQGLKDNLFVILQHRVAQYNAV